jgi:hypothetical protein
MQRLQIIQDWFENTASLKEIQDQFAGGKILVKDDCYHFERKKKDKDLLFALMKSPANHNRSFDCHTSLNLLNAELNYVALKSGEALQGLVKANGPYLIKARPTRCNYKARYTIYKQHIEICVEEDSEFIIITSPNDFEEHDEESFDTNLYRNQLENWYSSLKKELQDQHQTKKQKLQDQHRANMESLEKDYNAYKMELENLETFVARAEEEKQQRIGKLRGALQELITK